MEAILITYSCFVINSTKGNKNKVRRQGRGGHAPRLKTSQNHTNRLESKIKKNENSTPYLNLRVWRD